MQELKKQGSGGDAPASDKKETDLSGLKSAAEKAKDLLAAATVARKAEDRAKELARKQRENTQRYCCGCCGSY